MSQLDNKIKFNETEYDITATYSDEANHTSQNLIIKLNNETQEEIIFNGSNEKNVSVVPSSGGVFDGPVKVESDSQSTAQLENDNLVTLSNVYDIIEQLSGLPFCTISEDGLVSNETSDKNSVNPVNIALGNNIAINALATKLQEAGNINTSYLCLSTDYPNEIYFIHYNNIQEKVECLLLSGHSQKLITIKENDTIEYTAESLATEFSGLLESINNLNTIVGISKESTDNNSHAQKINDINDSIDNINETLENNLQLINNNINNNDTRITDIIEGNITVSRSIEANRAIHDSAGEHIRNNYYRGTANSSNANTITISTDGPDPNSGLTGDIWITYSEPS
jgi:uncharacterized protein YoxC